MIEQRWAFYRPVSGEIVRTGGSPLSAPRPSVGAGAALAGSPVLLADCRASQHWVDPDAVADVLAQQAELPPASSEMALPAVDPDWQSCVRDKTASTATLAGTVDGQLQLDLIADPTIVIAEVPPWSQLRIRGPVSRDVEIPDGVEAVTLTLRQLGDYTITITSARHLPAEWTIHAS